MAPLAAPAVLLQAVLDLYNVQVLLAILVAGLAGLLVVTSGLSAARYRNVKLALAGGAFAVFAVKGALYLHALLVTLNRPPVVLMALDLAILVLMYLSVAKR